MYINFKNYWIWQLVLDGVVDMDVGYKASDPSRQVQSITVEFFNFFLYYTVKLDLSCSSCNFTERNNLTSADVT